jgi:hypothetical protein
MPIREQTNMSPALNEADRVGFFIAIMRMGSGVKIAAKFKRSLLTTDNVSATIQRRIHAITTHQKSCAHRFRGTYTIQHTMLTRVPRTSTRKAKFWLKKIPGVGHVY